jgi:hypothetical protein
VESGQLASIFLSLVTAAHRTLRLSHQKEKAFITAPDNWLDFRSPKFGE